VTGMSPHVGVGQRTTGFARGAPFEKTEVGRLDPYYQDTTSILRTHEGLESLQRPLADSPAHSVELDSLGRTKPSS